MAPGKGGKKKKRGKSQAGHFKRELQYKGEGEEYAQVLRMLGGGTLEAQCFDGQLRMAQIRGKMRKRVWIAQGDLILVSIRDFQPTKGDVVLKYTGDEARKLKSQGELPEHVQINKDLDENDGGAEVDFADDAPKADDLGDEQARRMDQLERELAEMSDVDFEDI